jgi:hypothetical protein
LVPQFTLGDTVVAISPDCGEKYIDTIYDPVWVKSVIAADGRAPVQPDLIAAV